ncbi:MAG TPA: hypothetical protein VHU87_13070 [Rhizomicrobium sp.]|nr:hypothetical protein [Rhizomicrobium sp.]
MAFFGLMTAMVLGLGGCGSIDDALFGGPDDSTTAPAPAPIPAGNMQGTLPSTSLSDSGAPAYSPSSSGGNGGMVGTLPQQGPSAGQAVSGGSTSASITPIAIEPGNDTGTVVSHTIQSLRGEIASLQDKIVASAQQLGELKSVAGQSAADYHEAKAHITTRLQIGTTRGNPELVSEWNTAQSALDTLTSNINALNALGTQVADESSRAHYVLDTVHATFDVSGAVDEDHRQLKTLEDETNQTIVLIDRLMMEASDNVQRQTSYVANERANLTTLAAAIKNGELYGAELGSGMIATAPAYGSSMGGGAALVTIKFDRSNVDYQQILYTALAQALQARPGASFDVLAVSPTRGTAASVQLAQTEAQRHAQSVMRSMTDMGVPATRLSVSSTTDPSIGTSEVRVYVR